MTRRWLPSELDAAEINSWGGQAAFLRPIAGVSDEACDALVTGADPGWSADERVLIAAVDELERSGSWSDGTWNGLDLPAEGCMRRWPDSAA